MQTTTTSTVIQKSARSATLADAAGRIVQHVRRLAAGSFTLLLFAGSTALACPNCSSAIKDDPVAAAFSWTTLFLIVMPLSLFGSIGGWIVLTYRRAARAGVDLVMPEGAWAHASAEKESER